jgi:hypothetical protein
MLFRLADSLPECSWLPSVDREERGHKADNYWKDVPEIPTVGHFTSLFGALAASYAIGWLTGKFASPHPYFEFNILAQDFGYVGFSAPASADCCCQELIG